MQLFSNLYYKIRIAQFLTKYSQMVIFTIRCFDTERKGIHPLKVGCWFVGGDDLTGTLHIL